MAKKGFVYALLRENEVGVLGKIVSLIVEENLNISHTVNIPRKDGRSLSKFKSMDQLIYQPWKKNLNQRIFQVEEITSLLQQKS